MGHLFNLVLALVSGAFVVLKLLADWIGRTTVAEDASALREKLTPVLNWAADQPGAIYIVAMALFGISALQLYLRWRDAEQLAPIFGSIQYRETGAGCAFDLPIKVRSWQGVQSRVTLELHTLDDERIGSFVLLSEQAALRGIRRVGRVTLDDTFKRFELVKHHGRSGRFEIVSEAGDYNIAPGHYRLTVTVSGAGPARSRLFTLHVFDAGIRLSDGTIKGSQDVVFSDEAELLPSASGLAGDSLRSVIAALDDMKAEGVAIRNSLLEPKPDFDRETEQNGFCEWQSRAMEALGSVLNRGFR
jgi:hypothetical protein